MEPAVITFALLTKPIAGANVESARKTARRKLGVYDGWKGVSVASDDSVIELRSRDGQPGTCGAVGAKGRSPQIAGGRNRAA